MKKSISILIVILWLAIWLLSACQSDKVLPTSVQIPEIVSFEKNLPLLMDMAKQWDEDAYLVEANIPIYLPSDKYELWLISASFQSPAHENLSLLVKLETDGKIRTQTIAHTVPIIQINPIGVDDWKIDSQEALTQFVNNHNTINILEGGNDAFLFLERRNVNTQSLVVWRLAILNEGPYLYLDANSGDELSITE